MLEYKMQNVKTYSNISGDTKALNKEIKNLFRISKTNTTQNVNTNTEQIVKRVKNRSSQFVFLKGGRLTTQAEATPI